MRLGFRHWFFLPAFSVLIATSVGCISRSDEGIHTYPMGERLELGRLVYTVFETQWLSQLGEGPSARVPQHRFFLVRLSVTNSSGRQVIAPGIRLEDDAGNQYPELNDGDRVPMWTGFLRPLKPRQTLQGNVVFDAPPQHYRLRVTDETEERAAFVDIPLTFGADTPPLPLPEREEKRK